MSDTQEVKPEEIHTKIWSEEPEVNNPFAAAKCLCAGYDVYGDILPKASWFEYLYLLFKLERPQPWQAKLLEKIAIAIANPGIRDHSVRAAMDAGVGGSYAGAVLMSSISIGAGKLGGARDVYAFVEWLMQCAGDLHSWQQLINNPPKPLRAEVWGEFEHIPGFDPHGVNCAKPVKQTLTLLASISEGEHVKWLAQNQEELENHVKSPLAMTAVVAAVMADLDMEADQAEMLFLLLRLPGAAVHALEQKKLGWKKYPFFGPAVKLTNDPKK